MKIFITASIAATWWGYLVNSTSNARTLDKMQTNHYTRVTNNLELLRYYPIVNQQGITQQFKVFPKILKEHGTYYIWKIERNSYKNNSNDKVIVYTEILNLSKLI